MQGVPIIHFGLGSRGPGKLPEKRKSPKVVRGGCKSSFRPREQKSPKSLLHHPNPLLHWCDMGLHRVVVGRLNVSSFMGSQASKTLFGCGKRGHYERGLFTGGISRTSTISEFSRISRERPDSPLFSTAWGFSRISRTSNSLQSLENGHFRKDPFSKRPPFPNPTYP